MDFLKLVSEFGFGTAVVIKWFNLPKDKPFKDELTFEQWFAAFQSAYLFPEFRDFCFHNMYETAVTCDHWIKILGYNSVGALGYLAFLQVGKTAKTFRHWSKYAHVAKSRGESAEPAILEMFGLAKRADDILELYYLARGTRYESRAYRKLSRLKMPFIWWLKILDEQHNDEIHQLAFRRVSKLAGDIKEYVTVHDRSRTGSKVMRRMLRKIDEQDLPLEDWIEIFVKAFHGGSLEQLAGKKILEKGKTVDVLRKILDIWPSHRMPHCDREFETEAFKRLCEMVR